jgi:predicted HNH restriction endonuclease
MAYHGYKWKACDFRLEKKYGEKGQRYTEIYHLNPLDVDSEEVIVDVE